jgi:CSLREA domain-containing protein
MDLVIQRNSTRREKSVMNTRRSKPILYILLFFALLASLLGSAMYVTPAYAAGIIVNSNADTTADDGTCTLREAITNANNNSQVYATSGECAAGSGTDNISFNSSLSGATIYLASTLSLSSDMTIDGSALTSQITISGDTAPADDIGDVGVFSVTSSATVTLNSLTITKGSASTGAGIYNNTGSTLTVTNSTLSGNKAASGPGGGIRNDGTLTVTNSTFSGNTATTSGGGIRNIGALTVTNSTFSDNSAVGSGGGIYNVLGFTSVTITNSTFSGNAAGSQGGGIYFDGGTLNYANTIIANSVSGGDCDGSGTIGTNTDNLVEDGGCSGTSGDPALASLADNGGPTQTFALLTGSPAINAGDNTVCDDNPGPNNLDQRGVTRPVNVYCDIGAYEHGPIVTKLADTNDGVCDSNCSLREAIATVSSEDTITFDSSLSGGTIQLGSTLNLIQNMTIDGSALASKITVSGDTDSNGTGDVRVFFVHSGMTVTLDSLIITKGNGTAPSIEDSITGGGGILNNSGYNPGAALTVKNSIISGNSADEGGGIKNTSNSTLTITNSTISSNSVTGNGGGILSDGNLLAITGSTISGNSSSAIAIGDGNEGGGGVRNGNIMTLTNSTISGNSANNGYGGGILNNGSLTSISSTISGNSASAGKGGGVYANNMLNYTNTIIANSTSGGDCIGGDVITNHNNLVEDGTCSGNAVNFVTGDPILGPLADNGGPTQTLAVGFGSPAINAGDDTVCAASPVNGVDQRGVTRPQGAHCDIGAFEGAQDVTAPTITAFAPTSPSASLTISIPSLNFTASDNVAVTGYQITETSTPPSAGAGGWTGSAPSTYTVSSDGSYTLYPWAKDAAGNVSSVFGSLASVSVDTTAPTIMSFTATSPSASRNIPITAFTASDVIGVTGYKITGSPTPPLAGTGGWTASAPTTYSVGSDGSYTLYPWAKDATGHVSPVFGSPANVSVDTSVPTVVSSVRANPNPSAAASVGFIVTFSESVTGVDSTDFRLTTSGSISGAMVSGVSGSGTTYTVTVNTGSGSGTIRLDVADNNTIVDAAANPLGGSGAGNGAFSSGEAYTIRLYRIYLPFVMGNA